MTSCFTDRGFSSHDRRKIPTASPDEDDQLPVEECLLRRAALARGRSEREVVDAVSVAVSSGISWNKIGEILGTSAQAAQQRYSVDVGQ